MANLLKKLWRTKWKYILYFALVLSLLEFFNVRLEADKISNTLGVSLQVAIAFLTFFVVIALFRIENLRRGTQKENKLSENEEKVDDIIENLSKYGTRITNVSFFILIILFLSVSNKANFLNFEFKIHSDTLILSLSIVGLAYVFDGVKSSFLPENMRDNKR